MKLTTLVRDIFNRTVLTKRVAALTGGTYAIEAAVMTDGGTGYTSAPAVGFTGGGGSGAAGTAIVADGTVVGVDMTNSGTGYTSAPAVGFTGGGGSAAAATAMLSAETLDAIPTEDQTPGLLQLSVVIGALLYHYDLVSGTDAESSPGVIRPDDYAASTNEKVWKLLGVYFNAATILDGSDITLGTGAGTKLGTAVSQKLGLFGVTPIVQPAHADQAALSLDMDVSGGDTVDLSAVNANFVAIQTLLNAIRAAGVNLGTWKGAA